MLFGDRSQLQGAPGAAVNFHIKIAPDDIGTVGPSVTIEAFEDFADPLKPIDALLGPVTDFVQSLGALLEGDRIECLSGDDGGAAQGEPALVTGAAANDR